MVEKGQKQSIRIGNLQTVRDFVDVRDGINALLLISKLGKPGEVYNICSGKGLVLRDILDMYKEFTKLIIAE